MELKGSKTFEELKKLFAAECQARLRYLYFAAQADIEGNSDAASVFRSIADGELGHAHGHLEFIERVADPVTEKPIGSTVDNLRAAMAGEAREYSELYPRATKIAHEEGFDEIAKWFEFVKKAEQSHESRFQKELEKIEE